MIDERQLITELEIEIGETYNSDICYGLKRAIEIVKHRLKVGEWIPCSERLPSESGKYFATGIKGSVYIAEFSKGVINGKPVSLWCRSGGHYCNVIAWMELPPAYEGE